MSPFRDAGGVIGGWEGRVAEGAIGGVIGGLGGTVVELGGGTVVGGVEGVSIGSIIGGKLGNAVGTAVGEWLNDWFSDLTDSNALVESRASGSAAATDFPSYAKGCPKPPSKDLCGKWAQEILNRVFGAGSAYSELKKACERHRVWWK